MPEVGKGHETSQCNTDMSRVRCFRCGEMGHVSVKCPSQKGKSSGKSTPSGGGSPKGQSKGKGSGGAKGLKGKEVKGKKGKTQGKGKMHEMHEVTWDGDAQLLV